MRVAPVHVVAGALTDPAGRVLIAERPAGKAHAGRWEFPGGKLHAAESPRDGLARELAEELGIELLKCVPLLAVTHCYPGGGTPILVDCWRVELWRGVPQSLDGQRLRWCTGAELAAADILEADRAIVTALLLPALFVRASVRPALGRPTSAAPAAGRVGWLLEAGANRTLPAGDAAFLIDPAAPPPAGVGAVYSAPARVVRAPSREVPVGCIVAGPREAEEAGRAGADFLLIVDRGLAATELAAVAAVGLPWYLNVAERGQREAPPATGRLWWRDSGATGTR